jgi:hypothetical protein
MMIKAGQSRHIYEPTDNATLNNEQVAKLGLV